MKQLNQLDEIAQDICNRLIEQFKGLDFKTINEVKETNHLAIAKIIIEQDSEILLQINKHSLYPYPQFALNLDKDDLFKNVQFFP